MKKMNTIERKEEELIEEELKNLEQKNGKSVVENLRQSLYIKLRANGMNALKKSPFEKKRKQR